MYYSVIYLNGLRKTKRDLKSEEPVSQSRFKSTTYRMSVYNVTV
jgi:hypothetical protein